VFLCGALAWTCLLSLEIEASGFAPTILLARVSYVIGLACGYSALFGAGLCLLHALRNRSIAWTRHPDRAISALLMAALAWPSYRQAALLTSGSWLLESAAALPIRIVVVALLLFANLALWHVHLWSIGAPGYRPWRWLARSERVASLRLRGLVPIAALLLGGLLLMAFARTVGRGLRAYVFFSRFLLPSAWLFATTLALACCVRRSQRRRPLRVIAALVLTCGVVLRWFVPSDMRKARAEFERRGGLIALTGLALQVQRGAPSVNLDIARPSRFHCPPPLPHPAPSQLLTDQRDRRNVILISVDTLRKDALAMRVDGKPAAPSLADFAAHNLSFERAVTTYPATLFALSSALTGQSASEVLFAPKPPPNLFTLTQSIFREQWIALPSAGWFRRSPVPELFTQNVMPTFWPNAERSTDWMIARLRAARAAHHRTFAWIHYYEPHASQQSGSGETARERARDSYARLVSLVDAQIGRLLAELDRLSYLRDSLVIVFSDHGEALGELDYYGHHVYLDDFATDIPLIVHAPGLAPQRSQRQVLLADIAPTVLEWSSLPAPATDARSLFADDRDDRYALSEAFPVRGPALYDVARVPITTPQSLAERMQLIRTSAIDYQPKVSLVSARYRLIVNRETGAEEFYDRVHDEAEEHDLSEADLPIQRQMREALQARQRALSERIYCRVAEH
jgi:arylsulfatase A-like enzyme